jgi:hypothetical protein
VASVAVPRRGAVGFDLDRERIVARAALGLGASRTGGAVLAWGLTLQADAMLGKGGHGRALA